MRETSETRQGWTCPTCGERRRWGEAFCDGDLGRGHEIVMLSDLYASALAALRATTTNGHYSECLAGQRGFGTCSIVCQQVRAALGEPPTA